MVEGCSRTGAEADSFYKDSMFRLMPELPLGTDIGQALAPKSAARSDVEAPAFRPGNTIRNDPGFSPCYGTEPHVLRDFGLLGTSLCLPSGRERGAVSRSPIR